MTKFHLGAAAALVLGATLVAGGCGGDDSSSSPDTTSEQLPIDQAPVETTAADEDTADTDGDTTAFCEIYQGESPWSSLELSDLSSLPDDDKVQIEERLADLVDEAPAAVETDVDLVADMMMMIVDGEIQGLPSEPETAAMAPALLRLEEWTLDNCVAG